MTEEQKTFTQEEVDEIVKQRLAREREKLTKETEEQLQAKEDELKQVLAEQKKQDAERAVRQHLASIGIAEEGRQNRIMRHVDLEEVSEENPSTVSGALVSVRNDLPELFGDSRLGGSGSGGSEKRVLKEEPPLTREEIENMPLEEQRKPGMKERIDKFLAGQR